MSPIEAMIKVETRMQKRIVACIDRSQKRYWGLLQRMTLQAGGQQLPRPYCRQQLRQWAREWETYLEEQYREHG